MSSAGVRPLKASGTWWIDHKIGAMGCLIEKFGLYTMHPQNVITATHSSKDEGGKTLEGKFKKLIDANQGVHTDFTKNFQDISRTK